MAYRDEYLRQVELLMRISPVVAQERDFALKGGTAINLYYRDMPRLSVDLDLMYLPRHGRQDALAGIDQGLKRIGAALQTAIPGVRIGFEGTAGAALRLNAGDRGASVKVEVSPVLRGVVNEPSVRPVADRVERQFGYAKMPVVSVEDVYAGKLVAALDRQHPRDLFDVRELLANEGITDGIREAFVVYMLSHNRAMGDVLSGRVRDMSAHYAEGFVGMTDSPVNLKGLVDTQHTMIDRLIGDMPERHRNFLVGFERGAPDWSLLNVPHAKDLPAVQWRMRNLDALAPDRREALVGTLETSLQRRSGEGLAGTVGQQMRPAVPKPAVTLTAPDLKGLFTGLNRVERRQVIAEFRQQIMVQAPEVQQAIVGKLSAVLTEVRQARKLQGAEAVPISTLGDLAARLDRLEQGMRSAERIRAHRSVPSAAEGGAGLSGRLVKTGEILARARQKAAGERSAEQAGGELLKTVVQQLVRASIRV